MEIQDLVYQNSVDELWHVEPLEKWVKRAQQEFSDKYKNIYGSSGPIMEKIIEIFAENCRNQVLGFCELANALIESGMYEKENSKEKIEQTFSNKDSAHSDES